MPKDKTMYAISHLAKEIKELKKYIMKLEKERRDQEIRKYAPDTDPIHEIMNRNFGEIQKEEQEAYRLLKIDYDSKEGQGTLNKLSDEVKAYQASIQVERENKPTIPFWMGCIFICIGIPTISFGLGAFIMFLCNP